MSGEKDGWSLGVRNLTAPSRREAGIWGNCNCPVANDLLKSDVFIFVSTHCDGIQEV